MRTFYTFFISLFSFIAAVRGQALIVDSTRFITGNNCCTQIYYAIPTADKGTLFVGSDNNNPGGIIPYFPADTSGSFNVLIIKMDSNRAISWTKVYGGSSDDYAMSAVQTPDGGYAVFAITRSNDGDVTGFKGGNDFWLLKIDGSGNLLWQKTYGSTGGEEASSIANTADNGFILLGTTNHADYDVPFHFGGDFTHDWFVVKTDSVGTKQWGRTIGGNGSEQFYSTILPVDSAYFLVGSTDSRDYDCSDTFWHPGVMTNNDFHLLKLDTGGHVLWDSSYGGSGDDAVNYAMFDIRDSTIMIIGTTNSNNYMVTAGHGQKDMWVIKTTKGGTLMWQKALGSSDDDQGIGMCAVKEDGYMVYGRMSPGTIGQGDLFLFKLDGAGNEIANKVAGGVKGNIPKFIVSDNSGYALTGVSQSIAFTEGTTNGRIANYQNAFVTYIDYWPLGINKVNDHSKEALIIYPNPAQNNVRISLKNNKVSSVVVIINSKGQRIYSENVKKGVEHIDIATREWSKGAYFVRWQCENGIELTGKLMVQ